MGFDCLINAGILASNIFIKCVQIEQKRKLKIETVYKMISKTQAVEQKMKQNQNFRSEKSKDKYLLYSSCGSC